MVAAGVVPIAHANDGGGSIRIPAACCGLVGLKPTRNRLIGVPEASRLPVNIVAQGVVTRSVRDTAAFYAAAEEYYRNPSLPELGQVLSPGKQRLKIGVFVTRVDGSLSDAAVGDATWDAARLCEDLGHHVEEISCPIPEQFMYDFLLLWSLIAFAYKHMGRSMVSRDFQWHKTDNWTKGLAKHFSRNIHRAPFAMHRLRKFHRDYARVFESFDILLSPTTGTVSPKLGHLGPEVDFDKSFERVRQFASFTAGHNVSGAPAISLPMGCAENGVPIGVQFSSAYGQDKRLLELALELEQAKPWRKIWMG